MNEKYVVKIQNDNSFKQTQIYTNNSNQTVCNSKRDLQRVNMYTIHGFIKEKKPNYIYSFSDTPVHLYIFDMMINMYFSGFSQI